MNFTVRQAETAEEKNILSELARTEFEVRIAPAVSEEAYSKFETYLKFAENVESIKWFGAYTEDGEPAGICAYSDDTAYLILLFVAEKYQNLGAGGLLVKAAVNAGSHGGLRVNAYKDSVGFYEKQGFKVIGALEYAEGVPVYPMFLTAR